MIENTWVFLGLTCVIIAGCAALAGQARAAAWHPVSALIPYVLLLGAADRFLAFALFGERLLSLPAFLTDTAVVAVAAFAAYRRTLARRVVRQYPWLYEPNGPFGWRPKADAGADAHAALMTRLSARGPARTHIVMEPGGTRPAARIGRGGALAAAGALGVIVAGLWMLSLHGNSPEAPDDAALPAHGPITIGIAGPMTGPEAAFGEQFRRGAVKAVEDINAHGGVLGHKLALAIADDACDPKQARSVAEDFAARNIPFVAGHFCSGSSIPASEVYLENGILQVSPASTSPLFTERGMPNVFRTCGRDDSQGLVAAHYVATKLPGKVVAIIDDKSAYGQGLADQFEKGLREAGIRPVFRESITAGEKDYSALVTKVKAAKADILYLGGYKTEGGLIVRQMRDQGLKTVLMGGDGLVTEEYWAITGPAGEGTLMTFSPDPRLLPQNAGLVAYFRKRHYEPEAYTLYTYATIQAWAEAARSAGTTYWKKVATVLRHDRFDTAIGRIGFDAKGDVIGPTYVMYVWTHGKYVYAP